MFLNWVRARQRHDDRGSALIVVIGIAAAMAIMGVTLVSVATFSTSQSQATRAIIQAQATAESSLDRSLDQLRTSALHGAEATFPCTLTYDDTTGAGAAHTVVSIVYQGTGQPTPICPQPSAIDLTAAQLTATSVITYNTGDGQRTQTRTVKQKAKVVDAPPTTPLFGHGLYSGANLQLTNTFTLNGGAGAYTNGGFQCNSSAQVYGEVTSVSDANITNGCLTKGVWAGGKFSCDSSSKVDGDVVAAGTAQTYMTNQCTVTGSVTAAGPVSLDSQPKIGGNLISAQSTITVGPSVRVSGYGRAAGAVTLNGSGNLNNVFANGYVPNSASAVPAKPPIEAQPQIFWTDVAPAGTNVVLATTWIKQNAVANGADPNNQATKGQTCTAASPSWSIKGALNSPTVATVIDGRASSGGCPSAGMTLQGDSTPLLINLYNDLTIVVDSMTFTNGVHVVSKMTGGQVPKFRVIVVLPAGTPAPTPGVAPTCLSSGTIQSSGATTVDSNVDSFFYTNSSVSFSNIVNITGSVYACSTAFANGTTLTYADMTPPAMTGPSDPHYGFTPTTRYNVGPGVG